MNIWWAWVADHLVGFGPVSSGSKHNIQSQPETKYLNFFKLNFFGLENYETSFF